MSVGKIHPKNTLFMHVHCGTASDGEGQEYDLATGLGGGLYIFSKTTGKTWALDWQEALRLAVDAGIDNAEEA
ncbi:MAG: hypothetical protein WBG17_00910 [Burkholderiaceae bacterium]